MKNVTVSVGMATCGLASGAKKVYEALKKITDQYSGYEINVRQTGCVGMCHNEPIVDVEVDGLSKVTYRQVSPETIGSILDAHLLKNSFLPELAFGQMSGASKDTPVITGLSLSSETDYFRKQVKIVSKRCGVIDPASIDDYLATGGYDALKKILRVFLQSRSLRL